MNRGASIYIWENAASEKYIRRRANWLQQCQGYPAATTSAVSTVLAPVSVAGKIFGELYKYFFGISHAETEYAKGEKLLKTNRIWQGRAEIPVTINIIEDCTCSDDHLVEKSIYDTDSLAKWPTKRFEIWSAILHTPPFRYLIDSTKATMAWQRDSFLF